MLSSSVNAFFSQLPVDPYCPKRLAPQIQHVTFLVLSKHICCLYHANTTTGKDVKRHSFRFVVRKCSLRTFDDKLSRFAKGKSLNPELSHEI